MIVTLARVGEAKGIVDFDARSALYELFKVVCDCI
jgi:hypothetical protein